VSKSVTIQIDAGDYKILKAGHYMLCFAKKIEDTYAVIWQSYDNFFAESSFSWLPSYQLFGASTFNPIAGQTNAVNIMVGQQATLDSSGTLGSAVEGGAPDQITMINNYGPIYPGLNCTSTGPDGVQRTTPVFAARDPIVLGVEQLKPTEQVKVWFQQHGASSMLLYRAISNAVEIDLTTLDSATLIFQNGSWVTPV
jgi:hypothetical protein